jgi:hypothetical protein
VSLAILLFSTGARAQATAHLREALARWPDAPELLLLAIDLFTDPGQRTALLERLARLEPDGTNPLIERTRAGIERGEERPAFAATLADDR